MAKSDRYKSQICIAGKRRGDMAGIIKAIFGKSFLNVDLTPDQRGFIICVAIYSDDDLRKITESEANPKFELCEFKAFKPFELELNPGKKK